MQRAHQTPQITSIVGQAPGHICIKLLGRHSTVVAHFGSSPPPPIQVVGRPPRELSCVIAVVDAGCGVVVRFSRSRCPEEKSCATARCHTVGVLLLVGLACESLRSGGKSGILLANVPTSSCLGTGRSKLSELSVLRGGPGHRGARCCRREGSGREWAVWGVGAALARSPGWQALLINSETPSHTSNDLPHHSLELHVLASGIAACVPFATFFWHHGAFLHPLPKDKQKCSSRYGRRSAVVDRPSTM